MLDEQIEHSKITRVRRFRKAMITAAICFFVILLIFLFSKKFSLGRYNNKAAETLDIEQIIPLKGQPSLSLENQKNTEEQRKAFQQALVFFENTYQQLFTNADFSAWASLSLEDINTNKKEALRLFSMGEYSDAKERLTYVSQKVEQAKIDWQQAYEEKLLQAQESFDAQSIKLAQLFLNQAYKIQSLEPRAVLLQKKLSIYPKVASLLQLLSVARAENDLMKQRDLIQKILVLDPARPSLIADQQRLNKALEERRFKHYIKKSLDAFASDNNREAIQALDRAKAVYPERIEVRRLQEKIQLQQKQANNRELLARIQQSVIADDWHAVFKLSQRMQSDSSTAKEYRDIAQKIIEAQRMASDYIQSPQRLQDTSIRQQADAFVKNNLSLTLQSPQFSQQIKRLSELIVLASKERELVIRSDGKTDIWVLGKGHVGKINDRSIFLPAGDYILEGRCEGYRNKQVRVFLAAQQTTITNTVSITCDERIR